VCEQFVGTVTDEIDDQAALVDAVDKSGARLRLGHSRDAGRAHRRKFHQVDLFDIQGCGHITLRQPLRLPCVLEFLPLAAGDQLVIPDDGHGFAPLLRQRFGLILDQFGDHALRFIDRLHRQPPDGHLHAVVGPLEVGEPVVAGARRDLGGLRTLVGGDQIGRAVAIDIAKIIVAVAEEQDVPGGSPVGVGIDKEIAQGDRIGQTPAEFIENIRDLDHLGLEAVAGVPVLAQAFKLAGLLIEIVVGDNDIVNVAGTAQIGGGIPADLCHCHIGGRGYSQVTARTLVVDLI